MTNIVASLGEPVNEANRQAGMKLAGQILSLWLSNPGNDGAAKAKGIFDDLYKTGAPLNLRFFLVDQDSSTFELVPDTNRSGNVVPHQFKVGTTGDKLKIDGKQDKTSGGNKPMTIAVPEILDEDKTLEYLDHYVDDVMQIAQSGTDDAELQLRNYLLASIFLTRCH